FFFFFKQKTAYEITTGDWSSDVCSSDLDHVHLGRGADPRCAPDEEWERDAAARVEVGDDEVVDRDGEAEQQGGEDRRRSQRQRHLAKGRPLVRTEVHRRLLKVPVEAD